MLDERLVYVMGNWSRSGMSKRAQGNVDKEGKILSFFCWVCKKEIHGQLMYEHFSVCCPDFFKRISKPGGARKKQKYSLIKKDGSIVKKTRLVEVGYVEQTGRSGFDPDGISPELQQGVLHAESEENSGASMEDSSRENVSKEPEQVFKIFRRLQDGHTDPEATKT
jgi:hypothetical protein